LEVAELRERLGQNSQNSSKPPSSDPPSVPRPNKHQPSGRKRGGQRGHQGHGRTLLPPEQVDHIVHVDETGWPEGDKQKWLWINARPKVTVF
jgi:transposase